MAVSIVPDSNCCRHPAWFHCMIVARGFAVDVFQKFLRYFTRSVRYFIILARYGARRERLRLARAANLLPMDAKSRDRRMRKWRAPGNLREAVA